VSINAISSLIDSRIEFASRLSPSQKVGAPQKITLGPGDIDKGEKALSKRPKEEAQKADSPKVDSPKVAKNPEDGSGKAAPEVKDAPVQLEGRKFNETV